MTKTGQAWLLILLTPFFFYITHALAFFFHEYSHSFSAWILGFKDNPLILNFGDASIENILFFVKVDENIKFHLFSKTNPWAASFIEFSGAGVGNFTLFLSSCRALLARKQHGRAYYLFFVWFAVMNLANLFSYIPSRIFTERGDMA